MTEAQSDMDTATSMLEKADSKKDKLEATAKVPYGFGALIVGREAGHVRKNGTWDGENPRNPRPVWLLMRCF